jgi:hypothetical protein
MEELLQLEVIGHGFDKVRPAYVIGLAAARSTHKECSEATPTVLAILNCSTSSSLQIRRSQIAVPDQSRQDSPQKVGRNQPRLRVSVASFLRLRTKAAVRRFVDIATLANSPRMGITSSPGSFLA